MKLFEFLCPMDHRAKPVLSSPCSEFASNRNTMNRSPWQHLLARVRTLQELWATFWMLQSGSPTIKGSKQGNMVACWLPPWSINWDGKSWSRLPGFPVGLYPPQVRPEPTLCPQIPARLLSLSDSIFHLFVYFSSSGRAGATAAPATRAGPGA